MSNNIGSKFEDFIILKVLNHGQYGFVAKVKSKIDNNIYSMKRVDLNLIKVESTIRYYKNEYDFIKKKFDHQNVYKPISCFKQNNIIYIITEYMDGGNLTDLYGWYKENNQKMEEKRLLKIFIQCLRGLRYIHEQNIIHRYLKQDTIILDSNDHVKIINFKYAIEKDKNDNNKIDIGILTAPEMQNKNGYDEKVDVYSLGMIFSSLAYFSPKLPSKKDRLHNAIKKMINKEKTERPTSKESFFDFMNIYYPIIPHLKSFLHCLDYFQNDLLKLESDDIKNQKPITYKIVSLVKVNHEQLIDEFIALIKNFSQNGININNTEPNKLIEFLLYKMHDENKEIIIKKENDLNIEEKKSAKNIKNETRKKKALKENEEKIKNNKTIVSEKFLVTKFDIKRCTYCKNLYNENYYFKNENFIEINSDLMKQKKGDIKKIFDLLNNDEKDIPKELCKDCNEDIIKKLKTKFYKLSKYLIIFIDKGFTLEADEMKNLDNINLDKEEVESFRDKHEYNLISMLTEDNGNYNYYYKKGGNLFHKNYGEKNKKGETVHKLEEISENIIALYYYDPKQNDNENINNNDDNKKRKNSSDSTEQSINEKQSLKSGGLTINTNFNLNIFEKDNNNGVNVNSIQLGNNVSISGSINHNSNSNSNSNLNNNNFNNFIQQNNGNQTNKQKTGEINVKIKNKVGFGNNSNNGNQNMNNNFINQQNINNNVGPQPFSSNQIRRINMNLNQGGDEKRQHS